MISGGPTGAAIEIHGAPAGMCASISADGGGGGFSRGLGGSNGKCGCINKNAISKGLMLS